MGRFRFAAPSRRCLLLGAVASGFAVPVARAATATFRSVEVDVAPLVARGGGGAAGLVSHVLAENMRDAFADALTPAARGAPALVARIETLSLSSYADAPSPGVDMGTMDSMEGAGLVVDGRRVVSQTPLRVSLPAGYSGAYYLPDIDARRIASLCEAFASWLHRDLLP